MKFLVGYLDSYPEHPARAFSVEELEENLKAIFDLVHNGTLETKKHGVTTGISKREFLNKLFEYSIFFPIMFKACWRIHKPTGKSIVVLSR